MFFLCTVICVALLLYVFSTQNHNTSQYTMKNLLQIIFFIELIEF